MRRYYPEGVYNLIRKRKYQNMTKLANDQGVENTQKGGSSECTERICLLIREALEKRWDFSSIIKSATTNIGVHMFF